ncbi:hypothetical protein PQ268_003892, partial [Klebsiella pneumoniae]|nr:hypothetical protein [Klebsiella pneumoniae]
MPNLPESPSWEPGIHQLEESERAKAGPGGVLNIPAGQLANRTRWLRLLIESGLDYREYTFFKSEDDPDGTITGLENTPSDKLFRVVQDKNDPVSFKYYLNQSGVAIEVQSLLGAGALTNTIRHFTNMELAEADLNAGNIINLSKCIIDNESNGFADEYINNNGVFELTGRAIPLQSFVDAIAQIAQQNTNDLIPLAGTIRRADIGNLLLALVDEIGLIPWQVDGAGGFGSGVAYISREGIRAGALQIMSTPDAILRLVGEHGIYSDLIKKDGSANFPRYALGNGVYLTSTPDAIIRLTDRNGLFYDIIDKYGVPAWLKKGNSNGGEGETTEAAYIRQQNAVNLSVMEQSGRRIMTRLKFPSDAYNHFIMQCQSLGMGFMCFPAVSKTPKYGNLMLGDSVRPASTSKNEFIPLGGIAFRALKSVVQSADGATILTDAEQQALGRYAGNEGESPIVGAVNGFRRHFLEKNAFSADNSRLFVASAVGLSGQSIASLLDDDKYYQRFVDCVTKAKALADSEGKSYSVTLLAFMQGERDYQDGTSKAVYKGLLGQLRTKMLATIRAITGQADDPVWLMYQTGYVYTPNPDNSPINAVTLPIGEAQYEFCQENKNCLMVGPNYQLPDKQGHLMTNGSRWMGCYFAKVADRVL